MVFLCLAIMSVPATVIPYSNRMKSAVIIRAVCKPDTLFWFLIIFSITRASFFFVFSSVCWLLLFIVFSSVCWLLLFIAGWKENIQKEATAKGFASAQEYFKYKESQDPRKCRSRYSLYKEVKLCLY